MHITAASVAAAAAAAIPQGILNVDMKVIERRILLFFNTLATIMTDLVNACLVVCLVRGADVCPYN